MLRIEYRLSYTYTYTTQDCSDKISKQFVCTVWCVIGLNKHSMLN